MRNPGDGDKAIRATGCGNEQVTAPTRVVEYEVDWDEVSVGVLDALLPSWRADSIAEVYQHGVCGVSRRQADGRDQGGVETPGTTTTRR